MSSCVVEQNVNGNSIRLVANDKFLELFINGKKVYEKLF